LKKDKNTGTIRVMAIFNAKQKPNKKNKKSAPSALQRILTLMDLSSKEDREFVIRAYMLTRKAHRGQKRYSGEAYLDHPIATAEYLAKLGMGPTIVAAGLLHDTLEDTDITPEEITKELSEDVYELVEGVTKLGHVRYHGVKRHTESLRKLFAATAQDVRVMIIKLADRLHNAKTLKYVPRDDKRERIANETLEIYVPIADRLGMGMMKRELEDAVFPFAYPSEYERTLKIFEDAGGNDSRRLERIQHHIRKKIAEYGIKKFHTSSRIKGLYSLYKKLERKKWDVSEIFDIWALRIIVENITDCYTVLGIVHGEWRPLPGRMKDYIASPKPNGYKSIHTTIHTGYGDIIELQIRTEEMHREAQLGIASHFSYKDANTGKKANANNAINWIKQFLPIRFSMEGNDSALAEKNMRIYSNKETPTWIQSMVEMDTADNTDQNNFIKDIKSDFFSYRIFIFTPRGDVIDLPIDSSPIDFAYAIHSDVGDHISGAKINGKMVSLDTCLKNNNIVEIMTSDKSHPTQKWLEMSKTTFAKRHIRAYLQRAYKE